MTLYRPAPRYLPFSAVSLLLSGVAAWYGLRWTPAFALAVLLLLGAAVYAWLASRPHIVIRENSCSVGRRSFQWSEVESLESNGWTSPLGTSPLVFRIGLRGGRRLHFIYPGDSKRSNRLQRQMCRLVSRHDHAPPSPQYRILRSDDEIEVERLFQLLKSAGRLENRD